MIVKISSFIASIHICNINNANVRKKIVCMIAKINARGERELLF